MINRALEGFGVAHILQEMEQIRTSPIIVSGYKKPQIASLSSNKSPTPLPLLSASIILRSRKMATFELYRRSTIGMCLTETLDEMVSNGVLSPEHAIQVLVQFDKSMTEALETQVKSKVTIKGHLHTYRFCDNVWTFILQDAVFKSEECQETVNHVKIVACDSKLLTQ
ncbi:hypothetical protein K7X08_013809 [Anisodus acutangulus]|uniref:Transcription initiation factor IIA subunit 2 n=1 Tax=Anisodus acutangulus TaxID=402998 RepID=A0A9Q1R3Q8_9SOLA|nr:hypothetical protein K7X08_013809 [Anisodus acutangulus]